MHLLYSFVVLSVLHLSHCLLGVGRQQTAAVKGRLVCNGKPENNVYIKMYDDSLLMDSKMGETRTTSDGTFSLVGKGKGLTTVDTKVNFYHNCNNAAYRCARKFTIKIPSSYITKGSNPTKTFDFSQIELAGKYPGESHDCIH